MVWKGKYEEKPKKAKVCGICWLSHGHGLLGFYEGVVDRLPAIRTMNFYLKSLGGMFSELPRYFPNLPPSNFHLFPQLKQYLDGRRFVNKDYLINKPLSDILIHVLTKPTPSLVSLI